MQFRNITLTKRISIAVSALLSSVFVLYGSILKHDYKLALKIMYFNHSWIIQVLIMTSIFTNFINSHYTKDAFYLYTIFPASKSRKGRIKIHKVLFQCKISHTAMQRNKKQTAIPVKIIFFSYIVYTAKLD
jgi:hypothetical protein